MVATEPPLRNTGPGVLEGYFGHLPEGDFHISVHPLGLSISGVNYLITFIGMIYVALLLWWAGRRSARCGLASWVGALPVGIMALVAIWVTSVTNLGTYPELAIFLIVTGTGAVLSFRLFRGGRLR